METGCGFPPRPAVLRAARSPVLFPFPSTAAPVRVSCGMSVTRPGFCIPAYAGRSPPVQSIVHFFTAENRSHNSLFVHRISTSVRHVCKRKHAPANRSYRCGPFTSRRRIANHERDNDKPGGVRIPAKPARSLVPPSSAVSKSLPKPGLLRARPGLAWIIAPRPGNDPDCIHTGRKTARPNRPGQNQTTPQRGITPLLPCSHRRWPATP